jgi:ribosome-binding factor A
MPKLIIRNVQMTILALQLDDQNIKPDPVLTVKLLKQLNHAKSYASTQDQRQKIASLQSILR